MNTIYEVLAKQQADVIKIKEKLKLVQVAKTINGGREIFNQLSPVHNQIIGRHDVILSYKETIKDHEFVTGKVFENTNKAIQDS
jgi:hypothetical protein